MVSLKLALGGIPESIQEGVNGFLLEYGYLGTLAERISLLADDAELRQKLGE